MITPDTDNPLLNTALLLARLSLQFARVERVTRHEDGVRPETDSDHTVMLALLAMELAPVSMSASRIAALAMVHDLPEGYAGDTQTLTIDAAGLVDKARREHEAVIRLRDEIGGNSVILCLLREYEAQLTPEARYVKLIDKIVVKLTHAFNDCVAAKALTDRDGFIASNRRQLDEYRRKYAHDDWATPYLRLLGDAIELAESRWT